MIVIHSINLNGAMRPAASAALFVDPITLMGTYKNAREAQNHSNHGITTPSHLGSLVGHIFGLLSLWGCKGASEGVGREQRIEARNVEFWWTISQLIE